MEGAQLAFSSGEGGPLAVEGVAHSFKGSDAGAGSRHGSGQVGGPPTVVEGVAHSINKSSAHCHSEQASARTGLLGTLAKNLRYHRATDKLP